MKQNDIFETIKTSFLLYFRTGNVVIDTMITGLIIACMPYLFKSVNKIIMDFISNWRVLNLKKESRITITGRNVQGTIATTAHYSINFLALLNRIKKLNYVESDIRELSEVTMPTTQVNCEYFTTFLKKFIKNEILQIF